MEELLKRLETLKESPVSDIISTRLREFRQLGNGPSHGMFKELAFCFMTANFNASRSIMIQGNIGDGFLSLPREELAAKMKLMGHRFPDARAGYIVDARKHAYTIRETLQSFDYESEARDWVVKTFRGIGYKEASHFLRNIGYNNFAIIDFHIIDLLVRYGLIERPKTLTKKKYLEIENVLRGIGERADLNMAELDLYLWYMETGKVLK